MGIVNNPHDKFVKETLGDVEIARDFLQNYLPENILGIIDMETLIPAKDTFVRDLKEYFSDLLFEVKVNGNDGYLYFLFEHKSYKDNYTHTQLLSYLIEIWNKFRNEKTKELPVVIPLVIYHGKSKWDVSKKFSGLFKEYDKLPQDIQIHIPDYEYLLYDLSIFSDEDIKGEAQLRVFLDILSHIHENDTEQLMARIERAFRVLLELESKQTGLEYFETYVRYVLNVRDDLPIEKMKKRLSTDGRKRLMSIAEQLRKEAKMEEKIEVAKNLLKLGIDAEQIMVATGLSKEALEQIKDELNE